MKLNLENLNTIAKQFQREYQEDDGEHAFWEGRHVYSIEFNPEGGTTQAHVAWPMYKKLIAEHEGVVPDVSVVLKNSIYCICKVENVSIKAICSLYDLKQEYQMLGLPDEDHPINFDAGLLDLFKQWQECAGWGLPQSK